jgi:hypothetical protein
VAVEAVQIIARAERLRSDRGTLDSHREEIKDLIYPSGDSFITIQAPGQKAHQKVFDSTGEQASELLAAALQAMLADPNSKWLAMRSLDPAIADDEECQLWMEMATDRMDAVYKSPRANFAPQQHEKYMDLSAYGMGAMYIADRPGDLPLFSARPLIEIFCAENADGRIDTNYRWFEMTAEQAVTCPEFRGLDLGEKIKIAAADAKKKDNKFKFVHAIYPREGGKADALSPKRRAFASCFVAVDDKKLIKEGGYHEFPFALPRWMKRAGEVYGRGPGMQVLADVKMLQRAMKITIRGVEKIVDPALLVADEGVLSPVRVSPSAMIHVRQDLLTGASSPVRPLLTGGKPDLAEEFMQGVRKRILAGFKADLIQFARDPNMTATQYLGITEQTMTVLAPIVARLQMEDLGPMNDRLFGIMWRGGMLFDFERWPELGYPAKLQGADLRFEYVSPMVKARRVGEARAVAQWFEIMKPAIDRDPSVLDNMDLDQTGRGVADIVGIRKSWMRGTDKVLALRQQQRQIAEQQMQMDHLEQGADAAHTLAKTAETAKGVLTPANDQLARAA